MTEQHIFVLSERALADAIGQIKDHQWNHRKPEWFATGRQGDPSLREIVNYHAYDSAWVPDVLAGRTIAEVGDAYEHLKTDTGVDYRPHSEKAIGQFRRWTTLTSSFICHTGLPRARVSQAHHELSRLPRFTTSRNGSAPTRDCRMHSSKACGMSSCRISRHGARWACSRRRCRCAMMPRSRTGFSVSSAEIRARFARGACGQRAYGSRSGRRDRRREDSSPTVLPVAGSTVQSKTGVSPHRVNAATTSSDALVITVLVVCLSARVGSALVAHHCCDAAVVGERDASVGGAGDVYVGLDVVRSLRVSYQLMSTAPVTASRPASCRTDRGPRPQGRR